MFGVVSYYLISSQFIRFVIFFIKLKLKTSYFFNQLEVSNQIRSINYQLSNLKYIQEGWTVRPDSPFDLDDEMNVDEVELNLLARSSAIKSKVKVSITYSLMKRFPTIQIKLAFYLFKY